MESAPEQQPDSQPSRTTGIGQEQTSTGSKKKKVLLGFTSLGVVCLVAGLTYGLLAMYTPKQTASVAETTSVQKVETPSVIDESIQSDIEAEQKVDDSLSDEESQTIVEEANATQSMEGSYANL